MFCQNRRDFLKLSLATGASMTIPFVFNTMYVEGFKVRYAGIKILKDFNNEEYSAVCFHISNRINGEKFQCFTNIDKRLFDVCFDKESFIRSELGACIEASKMAINEKYGRIYALS